MQVRRHSRDVIMKWRSFFEYDKREHHEIGVEASRLLVEQGDLNYMKQEEQMSTDPTSRAGHLTVMVLYY